MVTTSSAARARNDDRPCSRWRLHRHVHRAELGVGDPTSGSTSGARHTAGRGFRRRTALPAPASFATAAVASVEPSSTTSRSTSGNETRASASPPGSESSSVQAGMKTSVPGTRGDYGVSQPCRMVASSTGRSSWIRWPAPSTTRSSAPGMSSARRSPRSRGIQLSSLPQTTSTGRSMLV
jgi:hypothetical protein